ncbi:uncharacterized protein LOC127009154 isoform X3 [Eriocheir sinensis]|uniref:uncharacterized protein LOC127009154 isoform X3 n=1 Tax=Eriocheir sinensis TaxID=95602 RepID=UPI0021C82B2B|nr:uncharacterized protein LOC127009154 isoform X3 [Eriocheir sinensis]
MSQEGNPPTPATTTTTTMSGEVGSIKPNPYIFDIENRRKRHLRLAHDLGAGAKCKKCGDKCPGFELHFWRKICMNCRCGKDDHEVEDDDQDIGKVVIGKLFDRPARTKKEELEFSYGNALEMVNQETGKAEKVTFDWVPPNTERNLAARYMALLPKEKRPVAGSEAAKERRKQLEQQLPLYDMDASQRCENMPAEELQSFEAYLERIKTQVAGQGIVQEIIGLPPPSMAQPLQSHPQRDSHLGTAGGNIAGQNYPAQPLQSYPPKDSQVGISDGTVSGGKYPAATTMGDPLFGEGADRYAVPSAPPLHQPLDQQHQQTGPKEDTRQPGFKAFMEGMVSGSGRYNVASSQPYGVAPGTAHLLRAAGQGVGGVAGQLSGLNLAGSKEVPTTGEPQLGPSAGGVHEGEPPLLHTSGSAGVWPPPPASVYGYIQTPRMQSASSQGTPGQQGFVPGTQKTLPGQQGFVPGTQGTLPGQQGFVPGTQGTLPGQQGFVPGTQGTLPGKEGIVPGIQGPLPGQQGYVPGTQGTLPGQEGIVPGTQGPLPGQQGYVPGTQGTLPGQEGFVPGTQGSLPGQQGFVPGTHGSLPGQEGFVPGTQGPLPGQEGIVPDTQGPLPGQQGFVLGTQGLLPGQEGSIPGRQGFLHNLAGPQQPLSIASEAQPLQPGRDKVIHSYHRGDSEPANILAHQAAEVSGSCRPSEPAGSLLGKEAGKGFLPQLSPIQGSVIKEEPPQAPYAAYKDTLAGGVQVAPGSDVTVLFPGESQVLGSQGRSGAVPGQKSKFSCQYCSLPMTVGDVAIFCERAGPDKCWHPACFCCFTCKELLADLIYFFKDEKVYCGRHFTEAVDMPRCKACDELIFGNSWTRADDADWHLHHYCCNICDKALAGQRYVPDKNGYPHCMSCYMTCLAKMCQTCEEKIGPTENRCSHRGYCYHANPQCFQCHTCGAPLLGRKFKMSKNWLFCSDLCIQAAAAELAANTNPKEAPQ